MVAKGGVRWLFWGAVVLLLLGYVFYQRLPKPLAVRTEQAVRAPIERTVANTRVGSVKACERSRLSPAIGGQIAKLYVEEGQEVAAGEVLLELWNEDRKALLQQARAMLVFAERERERVCITARSDKREARRLDSLLARKLASEEQADLAQSRAAASEVACSSAAAKLDEAKATVAVAEAALAQTVLKAPFAGIVAEVSGEVGEFSTPSPPGVATPPAIDLLTNDCHYVSAPIDEVDAAEVRLGMPVRITMDAYKGQVFQGRVRRVAAYVQDFEKQARTVDVEAAFDRDALVVQASVASPIGTPVTDSVYADKLPPPQNLIAGYSADIEVILATKERVLRIPTEALLDGNRVWLLRDGVVEEANLEIGIGNWRYTEVVSGLQEGDQVIVAPGRDDIVAGVEAVADKSSP